MDDSDSSDTTVLHQNESPSPVVINLDYMISLKIFFDNELHNESNDIDNTDELSLYDKNLIKNIYYFLKDLYLTNDEIQNAVCLLYDSINPIKKDNVISFLNEINTIRSNTSNQLNQILNISTNISNIFTLYNNIERINTDQYTGENINPTLYFNLLNSNLNIYNNNANNTENENTENEENEENNSENNSENNRENNNNILPNPSYNFINIFNNIYRQPINNTYIEDFNVPVTLGQNITQTTQLNENSIFHNLFINQIPITYQWTQLIQPTTTTTVYEDVKNVATDSILKENTKLLTFNDLDEINKNRYKTCSICIDDYEDKDEIRQLSCSHIFHTKCIDPWLLNESYKCPMCRDDTLPHKSSLS